VGALYSARALPSAPAVSRALSEAGAAGVGFVGLAYSLVNPEAVAEARKAGVVLSAWTVNEPDVMRTLIDQGIGILITDRPDVAKNLLNQRRSP
jgi:glycerophosphoryl diester phosphodiesterase